MRTRVKICGITRVEDALQAVALGADAIGLVFYAPSPRAVTVQLAQRITEVLPPFITVAGLFVDAPSAQIHAVLDNTRIDLLQFHGSEEPAACRIYRRPYMKAVAMRPGVDVHAHAREYADAAGLLLDSYHDDKAGGGTGRIFDWTQVPQKLAKFIILAGGLTPDNVAEAIERTRPYAVDVSGGVESAKGVKDAEKMRAFIEEVKRVQSG
jgi:phosphoribosylanthranilate isomerase